MAQFGSTQPGSRQHDPQNPPHRPAQPPTVGAPTRDPVESPVPYREFTVSPSDTPTAIARIEMMNQHRAKVGLPPIQVDVTRSYQADPSDPIFAMESSTVRIQGASQEELYRVSIGNVSSEPERKAKAGNVMAAAVAAHRLNGKVYVGRGQGENSVPDQVDRYIAEGPNGPMRQRLAPTQADKDEAGRLRIWVRSQQPTTDYQAAVRHALTTEYMSVREAGTAASALSAFTRYQERLEEARQKALAKNGGQQASGGPLCTPLDPLGRGGWDRRTRRSRSRPASKWLTRSATTTRTTLASSTS